MKSRACTTSPRSPRAGRASSPPIAEMDADQLADARLLEGITSETTRAQRIDLLQQLLVEGFSLEELRDATSSDRLALLPVERVLHREDARYTRVEIAELSGLPLEFLSCLWRALGLADPSDEN